MAERTQWLVVKRPKKQFAEMVCPVVKVVWADSKKEALVNYCKAAVGEEWKSLYRMYRKETVTRLVVNKSYFI